MTAISFTIQDIHSDIILQYVVPYFKFYDIKRVYLSGLMKATSISSDDITEAIDAIAKKDDKLWKCLSIAHISIHDALNHSSISYRVIDSIIHAKHWHWCGCDIVFDMSDLNVSKIRNTISVLKVLNMYCAKFNHYKLCEYIPTKMVEYMSDAFSILNKGTSCLKRSQNTFLEALTLVQFLGTQRKTYGDTRWEMISCDIYGVFERYQHITSTRKHSSKTFQSLLVEETHAVPAMRSYSNVSQCSTLCFLINLINNTEVKRSFKIEMRTRFYVAYELFRCFNQVNNIHERYGQPSYSDTYKDIRNYTMNKAYKIRNKHRDLGYDILPDSLNDLILKEIHCVIGR